MDSVHSRIARAAKDAKAAIDNQDYDAAHKPRHKQRRKQPGKELTYRLHTIEPNEVYDQYDYGQLSPVRSARSYHK